VAKPAYSGYDPAAHARTAPLPHPGSQRRDGSHFAAPKSPRRLAEDLNAALKCT
jgi:hypothetical protein